MSLLFLLPATILALVPITVLAGEMPKKRGPTGLE